MLFVPSTRGYGRPYRVNEAQNIKDTDKHPSTLQSAVMVLYTPAVASIPCVCVNSSAATVLCTPAVASIPCLCQQGSCNGAVYTSFCVNPVSVCQQSNNGAVYTSYYINPVCVCQQGSCNGAVYTFNPLSGEAHAGGLQSLSYRISQASLLHHTDKLFIKV